MSYSPERQQELVNNEEARLGKQITVCQKVIATIDTQGWQEIIEPLIDRMIIDIVGGKISDSWVSGKLDRAKKEERREFYIGYKQALIDLHSRIMFHKIQLPQLEDKMKEIDRVKRADYRVPLVEDTRYGPF